MITRGDPAYFLDSPENTWKLNDLVEGIRDALIDYQVCTPKRARFHHISHLPQTSIQQEIYIESCQKIVSLISLQPCLL